MRVEIPNNTLDIKVSSSPQIFYDSINTSEKNDFYTFTTGLRSSFNLDLSGLQQDADVQLIQDVNNNKIIDSNEEIIAKSNFAGNKSEYINQTISEGTYYIRVYPFRGANTDYRLSVSLTPEDGAGNQLNNARNIEANTSLKDWVGEADQKDYYRFSIGAFSDISLNLKGLNGDADINLLNESGNVISSSSNSGLVEESLKNTLRQGTYYVQVTSKSGSESEYNLSLSTTPANINDTLPTTDSSPVPQSDGKVRYIEGNFWAETFTYDSNYSTNIFSGNGAVNYNTGAREVLNLSSISSNSVSINLANTRNGGVVYNPGDGARVFDEIKFQDGKQILFESLDAVIFADTIIYSSVAPNDPSFNQQWNLHMTSTHNAWRFTQGNNNVLVGIPDTGLGTGQNGNIHQDLRSVSSTSDKYSDEWSGFSHGTSVAGTIAAKSNNGEGIAGINWNSPYYMVDVVGNDAGDEDLAGAVEFIINQAKSNNQKAVINLSLVGGYSTEFEQLIDNNQNNALFVIAAGNDNQSTPASPADLAKNYNNVISVGAVWGSEDWYGKRRNPGDRINYPNWWGPNYGSGLTLMAPSEFYTTKSELHSSGNYHEHTYDSKFNGTSAATPMVSGIISLLWSVNGNLTSTQIKSILSETATDVGASGYDAQNGHGVINADKAMRRAIAIARGA
ncbi:MAG: S8 family serine peptidase [Cyanobacteria bacterium P01_A01_bin.84]